VKKNALSKEIFLKLIREEEALFLGSLILPVKRQEIKFKVNKETIKPGFVT